MDIAIELLQQQSDGGTERIALTSNTISLNGFDCLIDKYLKPMTRVRMAIDLSHYKPNGRRLNPVDRHVQLEAIIVRTEEMRVDGGKMYHTAFFFDNLPDRVKETITRIIKSKEDE